MKLSKLGRAISSTVLVSILITTSGGYAHSLGQRRSNDLPSPGPPSPEANYRPWYIIPKRKKIEGFFSEFRPNEAEKRLLDLSREDQREFALLINQPDAGGFRLLTPHPWSSHPGSRVISIDSPEFSRRPGFSSYASSYSFTRKKHGHGVKGWTSNPNWNLMDLRLIRGRLRSAVADESVGLIVNLGDVPLEQVTEQTDGVAELAEFVPPADHRAVLSLLQKNHCAYQRNGFRYASYAIAVVNNTYVLRSTLNQRADQLIAFRVVREDGEGTLSIVWRKLKTYPKPSWPKQKRLNEHMYTRTYKPCLPGRMTALPQKTLLPQK